MRKFLSCDHAAVTTLFDISQTQNHYGFVSDSLASLQNCECLVTKDQCKYAANE